MNEKNTETIISIAGTAILTAFTIIKESTGIHNLLFTALFWIVVGISIAVAVFIASGRPMI